MTLSSKNQKSFLRISIAIIVFLVLIMIFFSSKIENMYFEHEDKKLEHEIKENAVSIQESEENLLKEDQAHREMKAEDVDINVINKTYPERGDKAPDVY